MRKRTRRAIQTQVELKLNALTTDAIRYITPRASGANVGLALHQGYQHLLTELIPKTIDDLVQYCVAVGVREPEEIARELYPSDSRRI